MPIVERNADSRQDVPDAAVRGPRGAALSPRVPRRDVAEPSGRQKVAPRTTIRRIGRATADDDPAPTTASGSTVARTDVTDISRLTTAATVPTTVARAAGENSGSAIPRFLKSVGRRIGKLLRPDMAADGREDGYRDVTATGVTAR